MSTMNPAAVDEATVQALVDRLAITDVLHTYSAAVDRFDSAGVRSALADDIWAKYGNADPVEGGDTLAAWIAEATAAIVWQHHQLSVYHVDIDGDHAKTLSYLTSHQVFQGDSAAKVLVARYHDELKRTDDGWKISKRVMELLWGESREDDGYLGPLGGRGPKVWARD